MPDLSDIPLQGEPFEDDGLLQLLDNPPLSDDPQMSTDPEDNDDNDMTVSTVTRPSRANDDSFSRSRSDRRQDDSKSLEISSMTADGTCARGIKRSHPPTESRSVRDSPPHGSTQESFF